MVGHLGAAPSASCSRNRRIAVLLVPDEIGGHDGTRSRFLLRDRQASRLLRPHGQKWWAVEVTLFSSSPPTCFVTTDLQSAVGNTTRFILKSAARAGFAPA